MKTLGKRLTIVGVSLSVLFIAFVALLVCFGNEGSEDVIKQRKEQYKELENGIYIGEMLNGKLEGKGNLQYYVGDVYSGEFADDQKNGEGEYTYADGSVYTGGYKDGKREGNGTFQFADGSVYKGQWQNDYIQGEGEYKKSNGDVLKGVFKENALADGTYKYTDDEGTYTLRLKNGRLTGEARAVLSNGDTYDGKVENGKFSGTCSITYDDGDTYSGGVAQGLKSGTGTYHWKGDGDYYSGKWNKDKMSGSGEYHYTKETFPYMKGNFQNNKPNGTCTYYKSKSVKYTTYWKKGSCTKVSK